MAPPNKSTKLISDSYGRHHVLPGPFDSIDEIKRANAADGQHWFEPDTMRFFSCRISKEIIEGRIFISSERDEWANQPRLYTIRIAADGGEVGTLGEFQQFQSAAQAKAAALRMVR